jgi:hypothetical protein
MTRQMAKIPNLLLALGGVSGYCLVTGAVGRGARSVQLDMQAAGMKILAMGRTETLAMAQVEPLVMV